MCLTLNVVTAAGEEYREMLSEISLTHVKIRRTADYDYGRQLCLVVSRLLYSVSREEYRRILLNLAKQAAHYLNKPENIPEGFHWRASHSRIRDGKEVQVKAHLRGERGSLQKGKVLS